MLEGQRYTAYRVAHKVAIAIIFSQQPLVEAKELGQVFLQRLSPVLRLATHARQGNVKKIYIVYFHLQSLEKSDNLFGSIIDIRNLSTTPTNPSLVTLSTPLPFVP